MGKYFIQGLMLGLAYVAPIGMQNLYVINTAITKGRFRALQVALITIFFDISLALACFFGMGLLMEQSHSLKLGILLIGSLMVLWIGISLIRSQPDTKTEVDVDESFIKIMITCFAVTWLNPQALIDGSLLLGSFRVSLSIEASRLFILGVGVASFSWFLGLAMLVSTFKKKFNDKIIRGINIVCGSVIIYYGLKLGVDFIQLVR